jgi:hypothetical protein
MHIRLIAFAFIGLAYFLPYGAAQTARQIEHPAFAQVLIVADHEPGKEPTLHAIREAMTPEAQAEFESIRKAMTPEARVRIIADAESYRRGRTVSTVGPMSECEIQAGVYYAGCITGGGDQLYCYFAAEFFRCACEQGPDNCGV